MKTYRVLAILLCLFVSTTYGNAFIFKAENCPKAKDIKKVKIMGAERTRTSYGASSLDYFNTEHLWVFIIDGIQAGSETNAIKKGNQLLKKVQGPAKETSSEKGFWVCDYHLPKSGLRAFATNFS